MRNRYILTGIKHSGKTTLGKLLAARLALPFYDTDDCVSHLAGMSARELYRTEGKEVFMRTEAAACVQLAALPETEGVVIATGGGICSNPAALAALRKTGTVIYIEVSEEVAAERVISEITVGEGGALLHVPAYIASENPRSLADVRMLFHRFYTERTALYRATCGVIFRAAAVPAEKNAEALYCALAP